MSVNYKLYQDSILFYIDGELDEFSANKIRGEIDKVIENNLMVKKVIFNFSNLNFMDSTGIGVLLGRYNKFTKNDISIFIKNPTSYVNRIFEMTGIYQIIPKVCWRRF